MAVILHTACSLWMWQASQCVAYTGRAPPWHGGLWGDWRSVMPFLGLDLGTTGVRALLIDSTGQVLGSATAEHPLLSPAPGWMEQNPDDWWHATRAAVRGVLDRTGLRGEEITAVAASGQMHGATLL